MSTPNLTDSALPVSTMLDVEPNTSSGDDVLCSNARFSNSSLRGLVMSKSNKPISQRSRRDHRSAMRNAFESYEKSLYPDDAQRVSRCSDTGRYIDEAVEIGFTDWKKAWNAAVGYMRNHG